jgi:hypothetical protein
MAWGRANETWNHTASIMAMLAAIHSDPESSRTPGPADYHPFMDSPPLPKASPEFLRSLFPNRGKPGGER